MPHKCQAEITLERRSQNQVNLHCNQQLFKSQRLTNRHVLNAFRMEMCRSLSDDEPIATNDHLNVAQVMFSTPVSSQKVPRASVLKSTRFQLPSSEEKSHHKNNNSVVCTTRYINVSNFILVLSRSWNNL